MNSKESSRRVWRLAVDTGGTFTDVLGEDPEGRTVRAKVLSSSALRARVVARVSARWLDVAGLPLELPRGFFAGYSLRSLVRPDLAVTATLAVLDSGPRGETSVLELGQPIAESMDSAFVEGAAVELLSPEEPPILAARVITRTPLRSRLPPIEMRLGTTRGTNALLERKGAAVVFFVTAGFGDLLAIGNQARPDLFALDIQKPEPLYREVVEIPERLTADGSVLLPLDVEAARGLARAVRAKFGEGPCAAAVALLHSVVESRHEEALAAILREEGFEHVALSSRLARSIKILPRAETAVVEAYLAPVLAGYLAGVSAALASHLDPDSGGARSSLHVMTSAGGLVGVDHFHAKDALLSGPAGGVLGAARATGASGIRRAIAFDMGGTSTDVARIDGLPELAFEHRVGAAHLLAPAVAVETVAAGGGSILTAFEGRLRVGPESAGAWPGPACYGAGGPLAITDVNLLLGRLDAERFGMPLDLAAAERAAVRLAEELTTASIDVSALLSGALEIANERMAAAIRTISIAKGYDPADYALVAFGGAGAQHACAVADLLGISTVIVPRDASLLSAFGLGGASIERFASRQLLAPLDNAQHLERELAALEAEAQDAVAAEGVSPAAIEIRRRVAHLRFVGQEATVPVPLDDFDGLAVAFLAAYGALYGYVPAGRAIEIESLVVSAGEVSDRVGNSFREVRPRGPARRDGIRRAWFSGAFQDVAIYERGSLAEGERFVGPCLVFEAHSATGVEAGWEGWLDGAGAIRLERGALALAPGL